MSYATRCPSPGSSAACLTMYSLCTAFLVVAPRTCNASCTALAVSFIATMPSHTSQVSLLACVSPSCRLRSNTIVQTIAAARSHGGCCNIFVFSEPSWLAEGWTATVGLSPGCYNCSVSSPMALMSSKGTSLVAICKTTAGDSAQNPCVPSLVPHTT